MGSVERTLQRGGGMINTAIQTWNTAWVDVRAYGAKGDGTTNDRVAINNALAALTAVGGGTLFFPDGTYLVSGGAGRPITLTGNNITFLGSDPYRAVIKAANSCNYDEMIYCLSRTNVEFVNLGIDGNYRNQASGLGIGIYIAYSKDCAVRGCRVRYVGYPGAPAYSINYNQSFAVGVFGSPRTIIENCAFLGNAGFDLNINSDTADPGTYSAGCRVSDNVFGVPTAAEALTATNWWDTQGGGLGSVLITSAPGIVCYGNSIFGGLRFSDTFAKGNPMKFTTCTDPVVYGNYIDGMIAGYGTVAVTATSATVTGTLPAGVSGLFNGAWNGASGTNSDVNQLFQVAGDNNLYRITAVNAPSGSTQTITVANTSTGAGISRTTASGLVYRLPMGGDNLSMIGCMDWVLSDCTSRNAGDMGVTLAEADINNPLVRGTCTGLVVEHSRICGVVINGGVRYMTLDGLSLSNNHQGGNATVNIPGYRGAIGMDPIDNTRVQISISIGQSSMIDDAGTPTAPLTVVSVSKAAAAVFTVTAHGLITGETVTSVGNTGDWTPLNATLPVTVLTANTFSVAINSSGYTGSFNGTTVANQPWQRDSLDINTVLVAQISACQWGPNISNRVVSNVALTGGTNGFTSVSLA